jgi:hypothetical protein
MTRLLSLIFFVLLTSLTSFSQDAFQVNGKLVDTLGTPISRATLRLYVEGKKDTIKVVSNNVGFFLIKGVPERKFTLLISSIGYGTVARNLVIPDGQDVLNLENFKLDPSYTSMDNILITVPTIIVKEDTVEYKADSFRLKPNAMVEDLLKKMPGIEVDKNGNITAQGKTVSKVRVNGKDFFSGDPKTATRELSADMIDKVQVIDDYGDLANASGIKDGEPDKIINLQLKKDRNKGIFGRSTTGLGTDDRYQGTANLNVFNNNKQLSFFGGANNTNTSTFGFDGGGGGGGGGSNGGGGMGGRGIQVNIGGNNQGGFGNDEGLRTSQSLGTNFRNDFKDKKGSIYGNYSFSNRSTDIIRDVASQNFFQNSSFLNHQIDTSLSKSKNHRASLNIEWNIDSFNYVKFIPEFNTRLSNSNSNSLFDYLRDKTDLTSYGSNDNSSTSKAQNFSGNLIFNHKFKKRGRNLSVNITGGYNSTDGESDKLNITNNVIPFVNSIQQKQFINTNNQSDNFNMRFNYSEPIMKDRYLDMIYSYGQSFTSNDKATYLVDPFGSKTLSNTLSNAFETDFLNQRIAANLRTVKKKYNYSIGLSAQPVNQKGYSVTRDSAYSPIKRQNFFPTARLAYNFTRTKNINFNYFANAIQPSFTQLQPVKDISNPQYQTQGNPLLKPSQNHFFTLFYNNLNFTSGQTFFAGANYSFIQNQIINNTVRVGNSGTQLTTYDNVNGYYNVTGFYNFSKPWNNRTFVLTINGSVNLNHNVNLIDNARNIGKNLLVAQGGKVEFNWKDWLEFDLGGRYGLNRVRYTLPGQQNVDYGSWTISSNSRVDLKGGWIFRYDLEYIINRGLSSSVNQNITLWNASFEKTMFKKKNGMLRISGFDIFKENKSIARSINGNNIVDTRVNRLTRYFMMTFTYRINKFSGVQSSGSQPTMGTQSRSF